MSSVVFLISLICAVAFVFVFREPLKRVPWLFYAIGIMLVIVFVARGDLDIPFFVERPLYYVMQKCTAAEALFVIVMFIGVFDEKSWFRSYLMPIRAEISILACILALGHIINYLGTFIPQIMEAGSSLKINIVLSVGLAVLLVILLLALGATSFNVFKHRLGKTTWKRIQWLAYPFFLLTYIHILLFLVPPALNGSETAALSVVVYSIVFIAYGVLRARVAVRRNRAAKELPCNSTSVRS